jgi:hypothetical protein
LAYLLGFHAYINKMFKKKIPSKNSRPYIYDVKFLALVGAAYIYDISRLRVKGLSLFRELQLLSLTQENAVDLHIVGRIP